MSFKREAAKNSLPFNQMKQSFHFTYHYDMMMPCRNKVMEEMYRNEKLHVFIL